MGTDGDLREQPPEPAVRGLRVAYVARPWRDVPGLDRRVHDGGQQAGQLQDRHPGAERQVDRLRGGDPADDGVGEHLRHRADEGEVTGLEPSPWTHSGSPRSAASMNVGMTAA